MQIEARWFPPEGQTLNLAYAAENAHHQVLVTTRQGHVCVLQRTDGLNGPGFSLVGDVDLVADGTLGTNELLLAAMFDTVGNIWFIRIATNTAERAIKVGTAPFPISYAIAITPDGKTAYVANTSSGSVTPIDIATNAAGPPIPVGSSPDLIAITPDGKTAYVVNLGSSTVTPIDIATNTAGAPIPVGTVPEAIALTPARGSWPR